MSHRSQEGTDLFEMALGVHATLLSDIKYVLLTP